MKGTSTAHTLTGASIAAGLAVLGLALIWTGLGGPPAPGSAVLAPPPYEQVTPEEPTPDVQGTPDEQGRPAQSLSTPSPAPRRPSPPAKAGVPDSVSGLTLPESDPVFLSIPKISVRSRLVELGLDAEGAMEVPKKPALAGWFSRAPTPGALGPAVVAGHVSWNGAPGVFYRLGALRRGDHIMVTREDGKTAVFSVERVSRFPKSRFPTRAVYGGIDHAGLRLITCGGSYDASEHRYPDNVVVFARLAQVRGAD